MPPEKTWGQVFKDPAFLITLLITTQFFVLIIFFSVWKSQMVTEAKQVILQSYVVGFTASWGFWLGSSASSRAKEEQRVASENLAAANGMKKELPLNP